MAFRLGKETECTQGAGVHSILSRVVVESLFEELPIGQIQIKGIGGHAISEERMS